MGSKINETNTNDQENTYAKVGDVFKIEGVEYKIALVETLPEETNLLTKTKKISSDGSE